MGRVVRRLSNLEIDEVSLVDRPANQHGLVAIAKADQENDMPIFDAEGHEVFEDELQLGDFVYDDDGTEYQVTEGEGDQPDDGQSEGQLQMEYETVGKGSLAPAQALKNVRRFGIGPAASAYGNRAKKVIAPVGAHLKEHRGTYGAGAGLGVGTYGGYQAASKSLGEQVLESLSKALTDDDRDEVISKAFDAMEEISKRNDALEAAVSDLIADREAEGYFEVAKGYGLGAEDDLGGLLFRASQVLPEEDVATLDRLFASAGEIQKAYFDEVGVSGSGDSDILSAVYTVAGEAVAKGAESGLTQEQAVTALFSANPTAYDEYEAEQRGYGR